MTGWPAGHAGVAPNRSPMTALTRLPREHLLIATSVIILIAALLSNIVVKDEGENGSVGGFIGVSVFGIALTAVLVLVVAPRIPRDSRRIAVLGFGIGAVVTVVAFWSMLPFALGAAALALAAPADDTAEGEREAPSTAGVLLALLAIVAAFVLCIVG